MKTTLRPFQGHVLDIDPIELSDNVLSQAHNVDMRRGFPSRIRGRRSAYAPPLPVDPYHALNFNLLGFNWWVILGTVNAYALETSNEYNISPAVAFSAISNPHQWSSTLLNGIPVVTNGLDKPHYWNGNSATDFVILPGWPAATSCAFIVAFRFHLFALNITNGGGNFDNMILWSDATQPGAVPTTWAAAPGNEAGSAFLADTAGRCVAGRPLGNQLMIYKPGSFYAIEYAGQQPSNIFIVRPAVRSAGLLSPHCLQTVSDLNGVERHIIVGNDDVLINDGAVARSIADPRIKRALKNSIDETNKLNCFTIWDKTQRELWVCVPESGSQFATKAHIWDGGRDTWVTRDLNSVKYGTTGFVNDTAPSNSWNSDANQWNSDTTIWNEQTLGTMEKVLTFETSAMYEEDVAPNVAVNAIIRRDDLVFQDEIQIKITSRVHVFGSGDGLNSLQIRLGARNNTNEGIVWGSPVSILPGGTPYEVRGRLISIMIFNSTNIEPWTVDRIIIEAEYDGEF